MAYLIKEAAFTDLPAIAQVQTLSWQQAYVGIVPQAHLDGLDVGVRLQKWQDIFRGNTSDDGLYVALEDGAVVGFVSYGKARDEGMETSAEIYAVYLLAESWGKGAGYAFFEKTKQMLREVGIHSAYLWVFEDNTRAINAYKKWGGVVREEWVKEIEISGKLVRDVMVSFDFR